MALAWTTMVIITKVAGDYKGTGLVEVIWKVLELIKNNRLWLSIILHDALHGFRQGRGAGTATMEENMSQQLAVIVH